MWVVMDVDAWWAAGDGGWELVEKRFGPADARWLEAEVERVVGGEDPAAEVGFGDCPGWLRPG